MLVDEHLNSDKPLPIILSIVYTYKTIAPMKENIVTLL